MALGRDCTADRSDKWLCGHRLRHKACRGLLARLEAQDSHGSQEQAWVSLLLLSLWAGYPQHFGGVAITRPLLRCEGIRQLCHHRPQSWVQVPVGHEAS